MLTISIPWFLYPPPAPLDADIEEDGIGAERDILEEVAVAGEEEPAIKPALDFLRFPF